MKKEVYWGNFTKFLILTYVTIGGGYELYYGIVNGTVRSSFLFAFLSGSIFIGRIGYGYTSGARKTMPADIYGLVVMWRVAFLRLCLNGW